MLLRTVTSNPLVGAELFLNAERFKALDKASTMRSDRKEKIAYHSHVVMHIEMEKRTRLAACLLINADQSYYLAHIEIKPLDRYPGFNQIVKRQVLRNYQIFLSAQSLRLNKEKLITIYQASDLDIQQVITGTAAELSKFLLLHAYLREFSKVDLWNPSDSRIIKRNSAHIPSAVFGTTPKTVPLCCPWLS